MNYESTWLSVHPDLIKEWWNKLKLCVMETEFVGKVPGTPGNNLGLLRWLCTAAIIVFMSHTLLHSQMDTNISLSSELYIVSTVVIVHVLQTVPQLSFIFQSYYSWNISFKICLTRWTFKANTFFHLNGSSDPHERMPSCWANSYLFALI